MNVVFVGGCHLVGKPHGIQQGFVRLLWKRWRKVYPRLHFDLIPYAVNWNALLAVFRETVNQPEKKPDLIIINIQAGLVLPTWERTLKRLLASMF